MKIIAFISTWNEEKILEFTLHHYSHFCDAIVLLDNYSTDSTPKIIETFKQIYPNVEFGIITCGREDRHDEVLLTWYRNTIYKNCNADWVIMADADELVGPKARIRKILEYYKEQGIDVPSLQGYDMIAPMEFEVSTHKLMRLESCVWSKSLCKNIVFNPKIDMQFNLGKHSCTHNGKEDKEDSLLYLKHYKHLGKVYVTERYKKLASRLPAQGNLCEHWKFVPYEENFKHYQKMIDQELTIQHLW